MRYFKPRKDIDPYGMLLPQKIEGDKQWYFASWSKVDRWRETGQSPSLLMRNHIEVQTEAEAIEGYE
jgi:hypothetical protein